MHVFISLLGTNDKLTEFLCQDALRFARVIRASIQLRPCGGCDTKNPSRLSLHCKQAARMTMGSLFQTGWGSKHS